MLTCPDKLDKQMEATNQQQSLSPSTSSLPRPAVTPSTTMPPQALITPMTPASGEPGLVPTVQNVVSTVHLGCELDLKKINFYTRNSEYNPQRFSGLVMRVREPRTTALVFRSGKMVITGARNESASRLAAKKFAGIIHKLGYPVRFQAFKVHNIVGTCDVRFPIRVESLNQMHGQFSSYEPELFPGLIYRLVKPRVVLLIFVNGKIVVTGAKVRQELQDALETIYPILKSFRKQ